jgi:glycerol-3-phosphate dehydrogenase
LIGTTEVRQEHSDAIVCSTEERDALVSLYNRYFDPPVGRSESIQTYSGLRPLLKSHTDATKATREYALERRSALVSIFGGKWTTSRALGEKAASLVLS